jgi:hypothetical protein
MSTNNTNSTSNTSNTSNASNPSNPSDPSDSSSASEDEQEDFDALLEDCETEQELHLRLSRMDQSIAISLDPRCYAQWTTIHQLQNHDLAFGLMYCRGEASFEKRTGIVCCGMHERLMQERAEQKAREEEEAKAKAKEKEKEKESN